MIYPQKGKRKKRGRPKEVRQEGEVTKESKDEVKSDMQKEHFNVTRLRHPLEVWGPTWCQALDPGYQRNNTANEISLIHCSKYRHSLPDCSSKGGDQ